MHVNRPGKGRNIGLRKMTHWAMMKLGVKRNTKPQNHTISKSPKADPEEPRSRSHVLQGASERRWQTQYMADDYINPNALQAYFVTD